MRYYVVLICALMVQSQVLAQDKNPLHNALTKDLTSVPNKKSKLALFEEFASTHRLKGMKREEIIARFGSPSERRQCEHYSNLLLKGFSIDSLTLTYSERGMVLYQSTDPVLKEPSLATALLRSKLYEMDKWEVHRILGQPNRVDIHENYPLITVWCGNGCADFEIEYEKDTTTVRSCKLHKGWESAPTLIP